MARAIDKQTMLNLIIEAKRTDPETGSFAEWLAEYLAEHLPTLTQPNEPLTLEQLRASPHGKIKDSTLQSICNRANEIACRPPEGRKENIDCETD